MRVELLSMSDYIEICSCTMYNMRFKSDKFKLRAKTLYTYTTMDKYKLFNH